MSARPEDPYAEFLAIIDRWAASGERTTRLGARLICRTPHVAPEAYFHQLYRGLDASQIATLEKRLGRRLPQPLVQFLRRSNGAHLFGSGADALHIWGLRFSYDRTGDAAFQPFDLVLHNGRYEGPVDRPPSVLLFGSCDGAEARLFFDEREGAPPGRIGRTRLDRFAPRTYWPDFWTWLLEETKRRAARFDLSGRRRRGK